MSNSNVEERRDDSISMGSTLSNASIDEKDAEAANELNGPILETILSKATGNDGPGTPEQVKDVELEKIPTTMSLMDPRAFPDGGLEAWLVVLGVFCSLFVSFGWINCIGVFQNYYEMNQLASYSPSTIAWIPSLETFSMFVGGPIFGKLYDNYGPRWILLGGSFFHVFGLMMTSISTKYYQIILAQGICSPLGASAVFYPSMSALSTWFYKNRALAFGVAVSGSSLGGVIFPIMVEHLVREVGFGWAMRISAFLILGMLIVANILVKARIPPHPRPLELMEFISPLREIPFALLTTAMFLFFFGMFLPFTFIILQAQRFGMSANLAGYLVPILNGASIFGRTLPGALADRIGRFNVVNVMAYFSAIIVLGLWLPARSNAPILVFAGLYGFSSGAFVSMGPALIAQISDIRKIGVRQGTLFAIISIAALTGSPIGGALVVENASNPFWKLQIFCGIMMIGGSVFFTIARVKLAGWSLMKKV